MANESGSGNGQQTTKAVYPLPVFCFKVTLTLEGFKQGEAFFKSVSGLKYETEVVDVKVGGINDTTLKLVGSTKWSNIVLKRGFTGDATLLQWRESWLVGVGKKAEYPLVRASGSIQQFDTSLTKCVAQWNFVRAWPVKWECSELDASKNEVAIETLELAHEGLKLEPPKK